MVRGSTVVTAGAAALAVGSGCALYWQRQAMSRALWRWKLATVVHGTPRRVVMVETLQQWLTVEKEVLSCCKSLGCIGFDCEWVTNKASRRPVALLQLATHTGLCVLVRLCNMDTIPPSLQTMLEDGSVYKVGVGPLEDCKLLAADRKIEVNGALDLRDFFLVPPVSTKNKLKKQTKKEKKKERLKQQQDLASTSNGIHDTITADVVDLSTLEDSDDVATDTLGGGITNHADSDSKEQDVNPSKDITIKSNRTKTEEVLDRRVVAGVTGPNKLGLSSLAEYYLERTLDKDWRVRASDWEAEHLTHRQVSYAAEDARSGIHVLLKVLDQLSVYDTDTSILTPLCSWSACTRAMIETAVSELAVFSPQGWCSVSSTKKYSQKNVSAANAAKASKCYRRAYSLRKSPLYHNSILWAPDDEPLCTVDPKKAYWYVNNNLGEVVQETPLIVRLNFEPTGRPQKEGTDGSFYLNERQNVCVVCGKDESYIRKNVVPHEYRKHFPEILKSHQNHDVVLLCTECHQLSNQRDAVLRYQLADTHNAPIGNASDVKVVVDGNLKVIKSAGKALDRSIAKLPAHRIEELKSILIEFFKTDDLTNELITKAATLDVAIVNDSYLPHGLKVYQYYERKGVILFEKLWRENFLNTMKPKFMPMDWSVTHNHDKLKIKMSRHTLVDPIREQFRIALVGSESSIDIPYIEQKPRDRTVFRSKESSVETDNNGSAEETSAS